MVTCPSRANASPASVKSYGRLPSCPVIDVVLCSGDPTLTVHHEVVHEVFDLGLFTDIEWAILSRKRIGSNSIS